MSDGVPVVDGAYTATAASDDCGAAGQAQIVKLAVSADGSAVPIPADADGILVNLGANNDVTVTGTVTVNAGTNLNTSTLLTTTAHDAAFGTAGAADAQVRSIQGIASMTPVQVQSNSVSLGTETSAAASATSLAVMDDWDNAASDGASVSGDVAHGTADAGEPVKIGAKVETSLKGITVESDADRTNLYADADGLLVIKLNTTGADLISERVSNTDGVSTAFANFTAVASTYNYVTAISAFRTDTGSTLAYIDFRNGTSGAILYSVPLPPTGGAVLPSAVPLFKTGANTVLAYDVSEALTTVVISVTGFQSKV